MFAIPPTGARWIMCFTLRVRRARWTMPDTASKLCTPDLMERSKRSKRRYVATRIHDGIDARATIRVARVGS